MNTPMKAHHADRRPKRLVGLALLLGALTALGACSLRYDFTECETNADCIPLESPGAGEFYQCVDSQCVVEDSRQCRTAADCGADQGCEGGVCQTITPPGDCDATEQCQQRFGESFYCAPAGECVDTAHPDCDPVYYADDDRDDVILLGSIIPTTGGYQSVGTTIRNGVRMAVIEYASNAFTLPSGHTVAHLHCEGGSVERGEAVARHMKDIGVPIIAGPLTSSTFLEVVRDVTAADDDNDGAVDDPVGTIAIGATSPAIGNLDAAGKHAFQIIANDRFQSSAIVDRAHDLRWRSCVEATGDECDSDAACEQTFGPGYLFDESNPDKPCMDGEPQIAVFYKDDQYGRDIQSLLISRFTDRYPDAQPKFYRYADPASLDFDETRIAQEFAGRITDALSGDDALPSADIVIFAGTGEAVSLAKGYISALPDQQATLSKRYMFSHGAAADAPGMFAGQGGLSEALMGNVEAVSPNIFNQPYYEKWQRRYSITFSEPAQTSVGGLAYDAAYLALFAMAGVPAGEAIDGANVTQVLEEGRLQNADEGTAIILEENTSFPGEARSALRDGGDIDMIGVSGQLDFVIEGGRNRGTVRSDILGFDIASRETGSGETVYEVVPARNYALDDGESHGVWVPVPAQP